MASRSRSPIRPVRAPAPAAGSPAPTELDSVSPSDLVLAEPAAAARPEPEPLPDTVIDIESSPEDAPVIPSVPLPLNCPPCILPFWRWKNFPEKYQACCDAYRKRPIQWLLAPSGPPSASVHEHIRTTVSTTLSEPMFEGCHFKVGPTAQNAPCRRQNPASRCLFHSR